MSETDPPKYRASLRLVPETEPGPMEKLRQRIKKMPRPEGMLQCHRCGRRARVAVVSGAFVRNGRKQERTVIAKEQRAECWQRGIFSSMLPELKRID